MKTQLKTAIRTAIGTCLVAGAMVAMPVAASISFNATGGWACQPSYGASNSFYFSNLFAENVSASGQYLACGFTTGEDDTLSNPIAANIVVHNRGAAAANVTCAIQSGTEGTGAITTQALTQSAAAGGLTEFVFSGATMPARGQKHGAYTASCLLPTQTRVGLLRLLENGNFAA